jgi:hypothetical protein
MRIKSARIAIYLALLISSGAKAQLSPRLPHRLTVPTFIVTRDAVVGGDLGNWTDLLQGDFTALLGSELSSLSEAGRVQFTQRLITQAPAVADSSNSWRRENALQVITAIGSREGNATKLVGWIYLGDLGGDLNGRLVTLPPTISATSYRLSRDIVRAATLYALSVDAGGYLPAACTLIARATQIRTDLQRRNESMGDLGPAIDRRRNALKCRISR